MFDVNYLKLEKNFLLTCSHCEFIVTNISRRKIREVFRECGISDRSESRVSGVFPTLYVVSFPACLIEPSQPFVNREEL
jgi:hypothetical protein